MGEAMRNDQDLLKRFVGEGSEEAFAELVRRHLALVYNTALRQLGGDQHRAADASQIVFTALAQKAPALVRYPALGGWLYARSRHAALAIIRADQRRLV